MEKNIHDDHLNDYVRKSFEDYEEDPSSDMWERIEVNLEPEEQEPAVPVRRYLWQLSAAAVIALLFTGLVCGRLYYENKIREITHASQVQQQNTHPATAPYPATAADQTNTQENQSNINPATSKQATAPAPAISKQEGAKASHIDTNRGGQQDKSGDSEHSFISDLSKNIPDSGPIQKKPTNPSGITATIPDASENTATQRLYPISDAALDNNNLLTEDAIKLADSILQFNDIEALTNKMPEIITYSPDALQLPIYPVPEQHTASGWYAGLQVTPVFLVEKTVAIRPMAGRLRLISTQGKTSFSSDYWLKIGKKTSGIWGFESGIGYRAIERNTIHRPRFRLLNGRPNQMGGSQERSYDFDYDLDTYGGSTEITLRMEQVDANEVIPETEALQFQVKISEKIALLRIPALVTAHWSHGRFSTVLKAGVIGNFIAHNEVDIVARTSENTRFRPGQGSAAYLIQQKNNGTFFMGYQFSAGLEYLLGQHFSLVLEPSIAGEFTRKSSAGTRLPTIVPIGINTGLNYYF